MTICVVGSGAREHALAYVLARTTDVVVTPGNPGMKSSRSSRHSIQTTDVGAEEIEADLFVIGPEAPLVEGLADRLRANGHLVFGPSAEGARLEGSKAYMKQLAHEAGVPTARFRVVDRLSEAAEFFRSCAPPYVIKTDGLAGGKGVLVTGELDAALRDVADKLSGASFGEAGRRVVVEEGLTGEELSLLVVCDGKNAVPLPAARDYKRLLDDDFGPNTGGMGAFSSGEVASSQVIDSIMASIVDPTIATLRSRDIDYRGVLYAGCMLTPDGPMLIEYNVRFGDPEAEVVLLRINDGAVDLLSSAAAGSIEQLPTISDGATVCVVLAADGYPSTPRSGDRIDGLEAAAELDSVVVFHGGTRRRGDGDIETAGGRVLTVSALGNDLLTARHSAYAAVENISFPGMQFRRDIAQVSEHNGTMTDLPIDPLYGQNSR